MRQLAMDLRHDQSSKMSYRPQTKVALLVESSRSYGRELLRGVARFAHTRSSWSLLHQEMTIDAITPNWLKVAGVGGVIARVDSHTIDALWQLNVPIVDVRCRRSFPDIPQVETDDQVIAELAFDHLWERGFRRFAFCGFQFAHFSTLRLKYFREIVNNSGCPISVYESPSGPDSPLISIEQSGLVDVGPLSTWLSKLAFPTGLFVCNDIRGQQVLNACKAQEIAVPDDLGIIGVDNDDAICLLSDPPLTSVCPNAEQVGYRAAEILNEMLTGKFDGPQVEHVRATTVVQRLSTQVIAIEDRELSKVLRFIREHACQGIDVNDVLEITSLSRRQLERRFRAELNSTPHQEITSTRIQRVKKLLSESPMTLDQISKLAGFNHKELLCSVFKRVTGETPSQYRRRDSDQE